MKPVLQWLFLIVFHIISLSLSVGAQEGNQGSFDTDFDIPEVNKKPYSFGVNSEVSENIKDYDNDSLPPFGPVLNPLLTSANQLLKKIKT
jgi:hypothetical protein